MNFITVWWLSRVTCLIAVIFAFWGASSSQGWPWVLFSVSLVATIILCLCNRCPHCERLVTHRGFMPPRYCPHCGESLD